MGKTWNHVAEEARTYPNTEGDAWDEADTE